MTSWTPAWIATAIVAVVVLVRRSMRATVVAGLQARLRAREHAARQWRMPWPGRRERSQRAVVQALPGVLDDIARALRGGASLHQACREASDGAPVMTRLADVISMADRGASLGEAIRRWPALCPLAEVRIASSALVLAADAGGQQARAVDGVAATLRERLAASADARSQSAQARLSALVIGVLPIGFALWASATDHRTMGFLFQSRRGGACLALGLCFEGVGAAWMRRVIRSAS
jgi:tight adherence protein B